MHRLLVTVLKAEPAGRRRDPSGLLRGSFRLRVKVKGAAVGALKAPARVVGLEGSAPPGLSSCLGAQAR